MDGTVCCGDGAGVVGSYGELSFVFSEGWYLGYVDDGGTRVEYLAFLRAYFEAVGAVGFGRGVAGDGSFGDGLSVVVGGERSQHECKRDVVGGVEGGMQEFVRCGTRRVSGEVVEPTDGSVKCAEECTREQSEIGDVSGVGCGLRGKHYKKNKATKERRRRERVAKSAGCESPCVVEEKKKEKESSGECGVSRLELGKGASAVQAGFFSECDEQVKKEFRTTRAQRYIEENKLRAARAAAAVKRMRMEDDTRLGESQFELRRQRVEVQLNNLREKRLGAVTTGWVESVVSGVEEPVAGTPSMSVGSMSPSSSMSVEQEKRLMCALNTMSVRIKELESKLAVFTGKGVSGDAGESDAGCDWNGSFDDYMHLKAVEAQDLQETLDRDVY